MENQELKAKSEAKDLACQRATSRQCSRPASAKQFHTRIRELESKQSRSPPKVNEQLTSAAPQKPESSEDSSDRAENKSKGSQEVNDDAVSSTESIPSEAKGKGRTFPENDEEDGEAGDPLPSDADESEYDGEAEAVRRSLEEWRFSRGDADESKFLMH